MRRSDRFLETPDAVLAEFDAEIGTSFANSAVANPRFAAAFIGTLVRGLGVDHVVWGTDSVW